MTRLQVIVLSCILLVDVAIITMAFKHHTEKPSTKPSPILKYARRGVWMSSRPVYQYSLVRGGIRSSADFLKASNDPVLASLYGVFDRSRMHFTRVNRDFCVYMSFRKGDALGWTKKCVMVHTGEWIMTDGQHALLVRCGNVFSYVVRDGASLDVTRADLDEIIDSIPTVQELVDAANAPTDKTSSAVVTSTPTLVPTPVVYNPSGKEPPKHVPDGDGRGCAILFLAILVFIFWYKIKGGS